MENTIILAETPPCPRLAHPILKPEGHLNRQLKSTFAHNLVCPQGSVHNVSVA